MSGCLVSSHLELTEPLTLVVSQCLQTFDIPSGHIRHLSVLEFQWKGLERSFSLRQALTM
jgi:hypothetical protein